MILLSASGLFRMLLIIAVVFVLLRVIGRFMIAKRNIDEHNQAARDHNAEEELKRKAAENYGKTTISKVSKYKKSDGNFVDFEEIKDD